MAQDPNVLAKEMLVTQKISGQWPLNELWPIFDRLTTADIQIETNMARIKKLTTVAWIVFFVSLVLTMISGKMNPIFRFPIIAFMVIAFVAGLSGFIFKARYQKQNLQNAFRFYLRPLLEHLRDDLKKDSLVNLDVDLSSVEQKQFQKGKSAPYKSGIYHKCFDEQFARDFLTLKLRLADGNRLLLNGAEFLTKTSKTKKNPRGKYKTKTVYKKRVLFNARLIVGTENFGCKPLPQGPSELYTKQSKGNVLLGVKFVEKLKGAPQEMIPNPLLTLQQILTLYTFLKPKTAA